MNSDTLTALVILSYQDQAEVGSKSGEEGQAKCHHWVLHDHSKDISNQPGTGQIITAKC